MPPDTTPRSGELRNLGPRTRVTVADDGIGFDTSAPHPGHYGLLGMREQAALVGATFDVRSAPGEGTTIELEFAA